MYRIHIHIADRLPKSPALWYRRNQTTKHGFDRDREHYSLYRSILVLYPAFHEQENISSKDLFQRFPPTCDRYARETISDRNTLIKDLRQRTDYTRLLRFHMHLADYAAFMCDSMKESRQEGHLSSEPYVSALAKPLCSTSRPICQGDHFGPEHVDRRPSRTNRLYRFHTHLADCSQYVCDLQKTSRLKVRTLLSIHLWATIVKAIDQEQQALAA